MGGVEKGLVFDGDNKLELLAAGISRFGVWFVNLSRVSLRRTEKK